jgi:HlyD family secretion protein
MKRIKYVLPAMLSAVALLASACSGILPQPSKSGTDLTTATVQRGSLVATVNAAGNITAHQQVGLNFGQIGTVEKVLVQVGDHVKQGQVLAELDTRDLALQLENAQNPSTAQDISSARSKVDAAQANYNKLAAGATQSDIAAAQAGVASAQSAYDAAVKSAGTTDSQLASAAAAFEKTQVALQQAQAAYDKIATRPDVASSAQAAALQSATIDFTQAKANYQSLTATTGTDASSKVQQAKSQLQQARASLDKLKNQVTQDDLTASQAQVAQAKNDLEKLLAGPDANALDIALNAVNQAEIAVKQVQLKLDQARIVAPFDGVVTAAPIVVGQNAASSATGSVQIADLDRLETIVNMAEVDVGRIKVGQDVQLTLDAIPDVNLEGKVTLVAPAGVQSQGVVNYPVTIALTKPPESVKTGMTANVNIVVDQRQDVLTVPNRAIRTQGRQKTVTVLFEGSQIQAPVTTGMSSDTLTEVVDGLKEGDAVVLTTTSTRSPTAGGPGGFGGPPGGVFVRGG